MDFVFIQGDAGIGHGAFGDDGVGTGGADGVMENEGAGLDLGEGDGDLDGVTKADGGAEITAGVDAGPADLDAVDGAVEVDFFAF